jgi:hypothetical protein
MYEVNIKADPEHFLDWDKPIDMQSDYVKKALGIGAAPPAVDPKETMAVIQAAKQAGVPLNEFPAYPELKARHAQAQPAAYPESYRGSTVYADLSKGDQTAHGPQATQALLEKGIPGIRYLDAGSRAGGEASHNLVVFDDKMVEILKKYGWVPGAAIPAAAAYEMQQAGVGQTPPHS